MVALLHESIVRRMMHHGGDGEDAAAFFVLGFFEVLHLILMKVCVQCMVGREMIEADIIGMN